MSGGDDNRPVARKVAAELVVDGDRQPTRRRFSWRWAGLLLVRLALDAALVDVAVETWFSGSPVKLWVAGPVALYIVLSVWALMAGARLAAPGIVTQTPAAGYVFLGILAALTQDPAGLTVGLRFLKQPTPVVLAGMVGLVSVLAALRFVQQKGTPWWVRTTFVAIGAYVAWSCALGAVRGTPFHDLLNGQSEWTRLPAALRGAYLGAMLLTPLAFARELVVSMQVLKLTGHLRWMVVFGLMAWVAFNAA